MKETLEKLSNSPMFHFSLHAKELFHSNFLAWLGQNRDPELRALFKAVMISIGVSKDTVESWGNDFEVLREKEHFDIVVKAPDGKRKVEDNDTTEKVVPGQWYVVIENKIKSIPTEAQLKEYDKKLKIKFRTDSSKIEKILLEIQPSDINLPAGWRQADYTKVVTALKENVDTVSDPYKKAIISDYCEMVESLIVIFKETEVTPDSTFIVRHNKEIYNLRIDDLINKGRTAHISNIANSATQLSWYTGYTNKQPLIGSEEQINGMMFGIQIQGKQYRHYIMGEISEKELLLKSNGFLSASREEFREKMCQRYPNVFSNRSIKGEKNKTFNSYGKNKSSIVFWYQYVEISDNATIAQIIDCVNKDMQEVKKLISQMDKSTVKPID